MKINKKILTFAIFSIVLFFLSSAPLLAQKVNPNTKLDSVGKNVGLNGNFPLWIGTIISGVLAASALIFLVMVFYAGILWLIAQGDTGKIQKAKTLLLYSVLGVAIMFLAYGFTFFLFNNILFGNKTPTRQPTLDPDVVISEDLGTYTFD